MLQRFPVDVGVLAAGQARLGCRSDLLVSGSLASAPFGEVGLQRVDLCEQQQDRLPHRPPLWVSPNGDALSPPPQLTLLELIHRRIFAEAAPHM
jgi:hypothetical protein